MATQSSISIHRSPTGRGFLLKATQLLRRSRSAVFDFFSDATQLENLTPPWLNFTIVTPTPILIQTGTLIDYSLSLHGVPIRWRSEISVWEPPFRFVDEQLRGPYRRWHHEHTFEETDEGTLCRDFVHYEVWGGRLVHALFVQPDLQKIFTFRQQMLEKVFSSERSSPSVGEPEVASSP